MSATALIQSIESVRRRARWLTIAYGLSISVVCAAGLLVGVVLLDYLLNLPPVPRLILMAAAICGLVWVVYRYIARPVSAPMSLSDIAGRLEKAFPQFEDRLRSTVDFMQGGNPGSPVLQKRVIEQATQMAGQIDFNQAVVTRPATLSLIWATGAVLLVCVIFFGLDSNIRSIIGSRLLTPFAGVSWPKQVVIHVVSDVPHRVPVGQKIEIAIKLDRGDKPTLKPILRYQIGDGPEQQIYMTRTPNGGFEASIDARLEQAAQSGILKTRIEAGDDMVHLSPVTIVPRLSIRHLTALIVPPEYVLNRQPVEQSLTSAPLVVAQGGTVTLQVRFNKPLAKPVHSAPAFLEAVGPDSTLPPLQTTLDSPESVHFRFQAEASFRFRVHATDEDGFRNTALEEYQIIVRPDANMTIQLENPRRSEERTPGAFVPLQASAEDDCGVDNIVLHVERLQPDPKQWDIPLVQASAAQQGISWQVIESSTERSRYRLNYQWELASLDLKPGDVIEYRLIGQDNFFLNGKRHEPVSSSRLRITIVSQEELAARIVEQMRQIRNETAIVRRAQQQTLQETQSLKQELEDKQNLDPADQTALSRLSQQQSSTASNTKQLAGKMQNIIERLQENRSNAIDLNDMAQAVRDTLDRTSEDSMKEASRHLNQAGQHDTDPPNRNKSLASSEQNQQQALQQLDRAMSKMENIGSLQTTIAEISAILNEQRDLRKANEALSRTNLGKTPEQMSDKDRQKLNDIAVRQQKLSERTQQTIDKMNQQSRQMEKSDPSASEAMKSAAEKAQSQNVPQNQQRAARQTSQNQQAGAQQSQQQAELGLETVLNELKEAERRELARLREQLAKLQEQIANLIRRQAGHNLDNLLVRNVLPTLDPKMLEELITLSLRKPDSLKPPQPRQLSTAQELTERNTRDLAKSADSEPSTATVAADLIKAAGKMERAIVSLRNSDIAQAYDPSQIEALNILLQVKQQIDQQKRDADAKADQQKKEAIRTRYVQIKNEQEKINAQTTRLEKLRDSNGNLPRTEWPTLGRLPKDELKLAEQIAAIEEDLSALGSIIYVWANKDLERTMQGVQKDLEDSRTGPVVQAEQERIIEQLSAMIDNLSQQPPDQKFEQADSSGAGGGSGGQQKPQIPTEAELKMLKSLQQAIHRSTIRVETEAPQDKPRLLSLGNRQGELRNLLDQLIQKASQGNLKLDPEPDNKEVLPEEISDQNSNVPGLNDLLLGDTVGADKIEQNIKSVGTRMARSRQRLAIDHDPGKVTQEIQKRILEDLDQLITQARQNQQSSSQQTSSQQASESQQKQSQQEQAQNQGQNQPGQNDTASQSPEGATQTHATAAGSKPRDLRDITEKASEWGHITPRMRDAVIESKSETLVESYRRLIEDYYEGLSTRGSQR